MLTQPVLIVKQMAAHNPFLLSDHLNLAPCDLHAGTLNETMNTVSILTVCGLWPPLAGSHRPALYETLCFNSAGTLKIKGKVCVLSNENEIGIGRLFKGDTQMIMKGCTQNPEQLILGIYDSKFAALALLFQGFQFNDFYQMYVRSALWRAEEG